MMNLCDGFRDGFGELMKDLYLCKVLCCFQAKNNFCFYKSVPISIIEIWQSRLLQINNILLVFEIDP